MSGRVTPQLSFIMSGSNNLAINNHHGTNRYIVVFECELSLGQGLGHELGVIHAVTVVGQAVIQPVRQVASCR